MKGVGGYSRGFGRPVPCLWWGHSCEPRMWRCRPRPPLAAGLCRSGQISRTPLSSCAARRQTASTPLTPVAGVQMTKDETELCSLRLSGRNDGERVNLSLQSERPVPEGSLRLLSLCPSALQLGGKTKEFVLRWEPLSWNRKSCFHLSPSETGSFVDADLKG